MASLSTRSSRRSEGLTTRSSTRNNVIAPLPGNQHQQQQSNIGRKKRARESTERDDDAAFARKKARIAIEINSLPKPHPKTRSLVISRPDERPPQQQRAETPQRDESEKIPIAPPSPPSIKPTNHHEKVVNGIKHELDRLQPNAADLKDEKRKLRSQEGTRFKSELSAYFPEYDEVIGNEPREEREFYDYNLRACFGHF